jgi:DNA polymerase III subunit alpha, Gram-positive type
MILFDTETTGLVMPASTPITEQPQIIEFAAIKVNEKTWKVIDKIEFLAKPTIPLPEVIVKITGLTDAKLKDASPFAAYYAPLVKFFLGEECLVGHNLDFDKSLLKFELMRMSKEFAFPWPHRQICTVEASHYIKNHRLKLSELHLIATGKDFKDAHRAMNDTMALLDCVKFLRKEGAL